MTDHPTRATGASDMSDTADQLSALRTRYVRIVREYTGLHETFALTVATALIDELQSLHGGHRVPAPSKHVRDQAIRDAAALGQSVNQICKAFGVHRCTVYRALGQTADAKQDAA